MSDHGSDQSANPRTGHVTDAAAELTRAHRALRQHFDQVAAALDAADTARAAELMSALLACVREHFSEAESLAMGSGLDAAAAGHLVHETFMERARHFLRRLQNPGQAPGGPMADELAVLLSDMLENDLRIELRIRRQGAANSNAPET